MKRIEKRGRKPDVTADEKVISMRHSGMSFVEIGKHLGKDRSTVLRRYRRAMRDLRRKRTVQELSPHV